MVRSEWKGGRKKGMKEKREERGFKGNKAG